jgi:hypothetical protein
VALLIVALVVGPALLIGQHHGWVWGALTGLGMWSLVSAFVLICLMMARGSDQPEELWFSDAMTEDSPDMA